MSALYHLNVSTPKHFSLYYPLSPIKSAVCTYEPGHVHTQSVAVVRTYRLCVCCVLQHVTVLSYPSSSAYHPLDEGMGSRVHTCIPLVRRRQAAPLRPPVFGASFLLSQMLSQKLLSLQTVLASQTRVRAPTPPSQSTRCQV